MIKSKKIKKQRQSNPKPIPKFKSEDEEREFWATHDTTEYFDLNKQVKLIGNITAATNLDDYDFQILTLEDQTGNITVIASSKMPINKTNNTMIIGIIQEYKNQLQISSTKIIQLDQ